MPSPEETRREVAELREAIDKVDRALLASLEQRAQLSRKIHALVEGSKASIDIDEAAWLGSLEAAATGPLPSESLRSIFKQIRAEARSLEQPVRVAYVGPQGGFGYQLVKAHFGAGAALIECPSIVEALDEVARARAVYAAFAWESSVEGLVQTSIAALAQTELFIVGGQQVRATFDIMTKSGELSDVKRVYATPAAHAACELFLSRELPKVGVTDVRSPLIAAQLAHENSGAAAIVPEACGRDAELTVARSNVGDAPDLSFRYGIASARPAMRSGHDITCLLFSVSDKPGALFDVLRHFAERGLNLKKLQSMPENGPESDYVFYIEVSGHQTDRAVVTALEEIKRESRSLKVLGSFPTV
jgi:chorismate mutase/prephenate dehydratase